MDSLPKELAAIIFKYKQQYEFVDHVNRMQHVHNQLQSARAHISNTMTRYVLDSWEGWVTMQNPRASSPHIYAPGGTWEQKLISEWYLRSCLRDGGNI